MKLGPVSYDAATRTWQPHFTVSVQGQTFHTVGPYDFATIYNLLPLWQRGYTGKGVTIAIVEDSNLAHPGDWHSFRETFGLTAFTEGNFKQIYPNCANPGQNGDEFEAALDVEWASASAPDANIELSSCANSLTVSGLDLAILNLLDLEPPDIISDSYGLCETITGQAEVALENREAQIATALGTTFFIAQGDTGADECSPEEGFVSHLGINSGDNTASAYAVDLGGTDFMAQYNSDVHGIPVSDYWSATNDPVTKASALSYIPEIPWNDGCTSQLIYSDPVNGGFTQSYGPTGFCNTKLGREFNFSRERQRRPEHLLYRKAFDPRGGQRHLQRQPKACVADRRSRHSQRWPARPARSFALRRERRLGQLLSSMHVGQDPGRRSVHGKK